LRFISNQFRMHQKLKKKKYFETGQMKESTMKQ